MGIYRCSLDSGIFYNHLETKRFKTGYFSVNFVLPLLRENVAYYALLPRVMRSGCASLPNRRAIVKRLEDLYGADIYVRHYGRGEQQVISFSADFLDNRYLPPLEATDVFSETLGVLRDLIFSPVQKNGLFLQEYVDTERRNCADTVRAMINNKQQYAIHRCTTLMCSTETAGVPILGEVEDFDKIDPVKLMDCYRYMLRNARIEIFYVGSSPLSVVKSKSAALFSGDFRDYSGWQSKSPRILQADSVKRYEETAAAAQGKLVLGFRTGVFLNGDSQLAYSLFNEIYGASPSSKLFLNVREKKSLCYSCYSSADLLKGIMYVVAGIDNDQKDVAIEEIMIQLDKMRQKEITEEELHCAKQSLANGYRSLYDSAEGLEVWYLRRILAGCILTPEEVAAHIMELTAEDVAAVARGVSLDTIYFLRADRTCADGEDEDEE